MKLFIENINKRTIIITEEQSNNASIFDFANDLNNIKTFKAKKEYCFSHFGKPIGSGTTRYVFLLNDNFVLKLARNKKGLWQNSAESDSELEKYKIFPKVYNKTDDNSYIISERVLKAKTEDFKECLGITFNDYCKFTTNCFLDTMDEEKKNRMIKYFSDYMLDDDYYKKLLSNEWFRNVRQFIIDFEMPLEDLQRVVNYGLTERYGKPMIVILDSGVNNTIWDKIY